MQKCAATSTVRTSRVHSRTTPTVRSRIFIAVVHSLAGDRLTFIPLSLPPAGNKDPSWTDRIVWFGREFYEHFVDDFDQFARVRDVPEPSDFVRCSRSSERPGACLGEIPVTPRPALGRRTGRPLLAHQRERQTCDGGLLKGPARFEPAMTLNNSVRNDQIYGGGSPPTPVALHDITPRRDTLRAFAVQPSRPRRYARRRKDSLRPLIYNKPERARS